MTTTLQVLTALPSLVKAIIELMKLAEEAIGNGKGSDKKDSVMAAIQAIVGNEDIWEKTKALFSGIVNMAALFAFGGSGKEPSK